MTGKYQGIRRTYLPVPVIVFANFMPDGSSLSDDRLCIHNADEASYDSKEAVHPLPRGGN